MKLKCPVVEWDVHLNRTRNKIVISLTYYNKQSYINLSQYNCAICVLLSITSINLIDMKHHFFLPCWAWPVGDCQSIFNCFDIIKCLFQFGNLFCEITQCNYYKDVFSTKGKQLTHLRRKYFFIELLTNCHHTVTRAL